MSDKGMPVSRISTEIAAEASVPFSSALMNVLCLTSLIYRSFVCCSFICDVVGTVPVAFCGMILGVKGGK